MQESGYALQSIWHKNLSHESQPIGGVRAKPLLRPATPNWSLFGAVTQTIGKIHSLFSDQPILILLCLPPYYLYNKKPNESVGYFRWGTKVEIFEAILQETY